MTAESKTQDKISMKEKQFTKRELLRFVSILSKCKKLYETIADAF